MFKFITNRPFWVNLIAVIALTALIIFAFLKTLGIITKHGAYLTVPAVVKLPVAQAVKLLESRGFEVIISDSVYTDNAKMGIVLKQFPEENSTVKVNRQVLLTVNRSTLPLLDMPALKGKSLAYAMDILKRSHLVLGDTTFRTDYMIGAVLEQHYNGNSIEPGAKIQWGSKVDLVIASGLSNENIPVPQLEGLTFSEAKSILEQNGILVGAVIADNDVRDTLNAFVYWQNPPRFSEDKQLRYIRPGQIMDVRISAILKTQTDSTLLNTP